MDYKNAKIYKITDIGYTKMYIGSTCQPLSKRLSKHKADYKQWKDGKRRKVTSFDLFDEFGLENCKIELIENYECNCKEELQKKEGEHIKINDCINKVIPCRTQKEYYIDNKDIILEKNKEYNEKNKDKILAYQQEYREANKDKINEKNKEYREANKDKISEYKKEYKKANKDKISEYNKDYYAKKKATATAKI